MQTAKSIAAVVFGILVLVLIVFAARFVGDKIKERFTTPKTVITSNVPTVVENTPMVEDTYTATYSAVPKTGPIEVFYLLSGECIGRIAISAFPDSSGGFRH